MTNAWRVLLLCLVAAACGDNDDGKVGTDAEPGVVTVVSAEARWLGPNTVPDRFDVTQQKVDPEILGVIATWEYTTSAADPVIRPQIEASIGIDGQPTGTSAFLGQSTLRTGAQRGLTLTPTDRGFRLDLVLGNVLGASDLVDVDGFEAFAAAAGLDLDPLPSAEDLFVEDVGGDGVLDYQISLTGVLEVDGVEIATLPPIRFTVIESDPSAEAVRDNPLAVARVEAEAVSASGACDPIVVVLDAGVATISTFDGSVVVEARLPDDWETEIPVEDPCRRDGFEIFTPDPDGGVRFAGFRVWLVEVGSENFEEYVTRASTEINIRVDDDGDEYTLVAGDDDFTDLLPAESIDFKGRAALVTVESDGSSAKLFIDAGEHVVIVDDGVDAERAERELPTLIEGLTVTTKRS